MIPYIKDEEEFEHELLSARGKVVVVCLTSDITQSCMLLDTSVVE